MILYPNSPLLLRLISKALAMHALLLLARFVSVLGAVRWNRAHVTTWAV
jgi:hypothetical protein